MQDHFFALADMLQLALRANEIFTCWYVGERSDFVRFNHGKVRQAGHVDQRHLRLRLIAQSRQASVSLALAGDASDAQQIKQALDDLRDILEHLPVDPYLLYATDVHSSVTIRPGSLSAPQDCVEQIVAACAGLDMVGIYASGKIVRGFANSLGQRNWHEVENFNFEWSLYHQADKAVKTSYAGMDWQASEMQTKMLSAAEQLTMLQRAPQELAPGEYRVFLAPRALDEVIGMLSWGGFSAKAQRTKQSPLIKMEQGHCLNPQISLEENTESGTAPAFQSDGFIKPTRVTLIENGHLRAPLVAPRSAKEYGLTSNGANGGESPESVCMSGGTLATADTLRALGRGLYVSNLWYLNFSDRPACRLTGMTRFATFWVENSKIIAPVNVMRFDDTIYRMLGENLVALTSEQEFMLDPSSYGERSTNSSRLPGALISGMRFTL
ncbi:MAG: metallopeptidase TldD-related protein [Burkholderiales bacterium]